MKTKLANTEMLVRRRAIIMALTEEGGVGPKMFQQMLLRFGAPEELLGISETDLEDFPRLTDSKIEKILNSLEIVDEFIGKINDYESNGISVRVITDDDFPESIRNIDDPPPLIYYKGNPSIWAQDFIALVGTTKATQGGLRLAVDLAKGLVKKGFGVVSGLAAGIDSAAHLGVLKDQGSTIAVLGGGIENIYPAENRPLADLIVETGLLISEYSPFRNVSKPGLILRNRLISAISKAVVVVQVGDDTRGELRTAAYASKQAKPLFYGDSDGNLDYEKVREWPGAIINSPEAVNEIANYAI